MEIVTDGIDKGSLNVFSWFPQLFYLQTYSRQPFVSAGLGLTVFEGADSLPRVHIKDNKGLTGRHGFSRPWFYKRHASRFFGALP